MIYLDNAATTQIAPEVLDIIQKSLTEEYTNPSGVTKNAQNIRKNIDSTRETIANTLGVINPHDIYFTSGGTEANNWAIKGVANAYKTKGKHIISQLTEHHSVLNALEYLKTQDFDITYISPDKNGIINPKDIQNAIKKDTILISIMFANNEIGTIQPIKEIATIAKSNNILFHTDAVQAFCHTPINIEEIGIDLLTISAHKLHGAKGVGALYIRDGIKIDPLIHGGSQERGRRGGTENVPAILGFKKAVELARTHMQQEDKRLRCMTENAINTILKIDGSHYNGDKTQRLAGIFNIAFENIEGEDLVIMLDREGIQVASGAACTSGSLQASHVIEAIGKKNLAHSSLRVSAGRFTTQEDMDMIVQKLPSIIAKLRG